MPLPTTAEVAAAEAAQKQAETAAAAPSSGGGGGSTAPVGPTLDQLLASANADTGGNFAQTACGACHSFDKGGATMVGPNLYEIVGAKIAGTPGYSFSDALKRVDGDWNFPKLDAWLTNPQSFAPGHHHELCRHRATEDARQRHRLSADAGRPSGAAALRDRSSLEGADLGHEIGRADHGGFHVQPIICPKPDPAS